MSEETLARLQTVRNKFGRAMPVSSAYRCPKHNAEVSSTGKEGPHTTGQAVDVGISGARALKLISMALDCGFTGLGVKQHGETRYLHLDDLTHGIRPHIWSYK